MSKISRWTKQISQSGKEMIRDVSTVISGIREFKRNGQTPDDAYFSMRRLYRTTNGRFNDVIGQICRIKHRKQQADLTTSLFESANRAETREIAARIQQDGFYQFPRKLPLSLCDQLLEFASTTPGRPISLDAQPQDLEVFNRSNPSTVRHQFQPEDLILQPVVGQLATDPYFFDIAQHYLGFNPVLDQLTMWWSAPGDVQLQSRAAQLYHFDMDRFRFVKFFVYLTDVHEKNGPHCYVRGSHLRKPKQLLRDERISDDEISQHYASDDLVELTGQRGTMLAVDTRGFHKGKPLTEDDRLIFQLQFADSLFGQNYPSLEIPNGLSRDTALRIESNQRCYGSYLVSKNGTH